MKIIAVAIFDIIFPITIFFLLDESGYLNTMQIFVFGVIILYAYNLIRKKLYGHYVFIHH